jgi:hypothetical protein
MNHPAPLLLAITGAALLAAEHSIVSADTRITPIENWSTAFAGDDTRIGMRIIADRAPEGTLHWSHSANQRTLARGEVEVKRTGDVSSTAEFTLRPPELREGVISETTVTTEFVPRGSNEAAASLERTLWLFPRNPLAGKSEWATQLDIELFDPDGNTADQFDDLELPYRSIRNAASVNDPKQQGVLIIGEGASLVRNRTLAENVLNAAAGGRRVVLLAPADGSLPLPGADGKAQVAPGGLRFARHQIIAELDKRLDTQAWPGTDNVVPSRGLLLESRRGRIELAVTDEARAWPWLEVRFPESKGVLVMCGFTVMEHWNNGPTPRFLLMRLLESLDNTTTQTQSRTGD